MLAVFCPFPYIALHVVKSKGVGAEAVNRYRGLAVLNLGAAVVAGASAAIVGLGSADAVAPPECALAAASGCVLALGLAEKQVGKEFLNSYTRRAASQLDCWHRRRFDPALAAAVPRPAKGLRSSRWVT